MENNYHTTNTNTNIIMDHYGYDQFIRLEDKEGIMDDWQRKDKNGGADKGRENDRNDARHKFPQRSPQRRGEVPGRKILGSVDLNKLN